MPTSKKVLQGQVISIKDYTQYHSSKHAYLIKLQYANITVLTFPDMAVVIQIAL